MGLKSQLYRKPMNYLQLLPVHYEAIFKPNDWYLNIISLGDFTLNS